MLRPSPFQPGRPHQGRKHPARQLTLSLCLFCLSTLGCVTDTAPRPPRWLADGQLTYPQGAKAARLEADVSVRFSIDSQGKVIAAEVIRTSAATDIFNAAALHYVNTRRYPPGAPRTGVETVVEFRLGEAYEGY